LAHQPILRNRSQRALDESAATPRHACSEKAVTEAIYLMAVSLGSLRIHAVRSDGLVAIQVKWKQTLTDSPNHLRTLEGSSKVGGGLVRGGGVDRSVLVNTNHTRCWR
jgi:hypothetical protein